MAELAPLQGIGESCKPPSAALRLSFGQRQVSEERGSCELLAANTQLLNSVPRPLVIMQAALMKEIYFSHSGGWEI